MVNLMPVAPATPPAPYIGGKRVLAKAIIARINETPHESYAEAFVGMGGVFLRRNLQPRMEVINDISGDVANLFRILQRHYPQFMETLRYQVTSRREFDRLSRTDPSTLTDLERAARFLYLQRTAFGGKVAGQNFGVSMQGARFNLLKLAPQLEAIHERMAGVVIEQLPWRRFIERYDRAGMLFYLDPPYYGNETDYGSGVFAREEFAEMADVLGRIKGRFILSLNAVPEVYEIFRIFKIMEIDCTYSLHGQGQAKAVREVIITGGAG
ncbi:MULTISPECIES: DNA adenine methylase [Rhizobium/Agrobacterium group]|uniref:site-specific DNA-methyltransferase (adenine-specific) n=2 Tax=Rhizobium/Agrobacterium group TaxID=227290 RepID=A0A9W5B3F8_9HYPH|nr:MULTISPECIES: DNA adenine methylase [Rhizobium/Agrobacterium group]TRB03033.1 DNA adenine methylase [Rhizobium rhizogenes]CUW95156.1 Adenine specific DNA methyltransferase, D12 class [Agrobacterium genomosp. 2 str. CFBP 5494]